MLKIKYNLLYEIIKEINKKIEESTKDYKKPSVNEPSVNDNQEQETSNYFFKHKNYSRNLFLI